jgi:peptidoglycan L-alanyl-D-glutamate endopeptidase CwlK
MFHFGKTSAERLASCHKDLQAIMKLAISISPIDFGISEGQRTTERQQELFREGKSRIDGISKMGMHNYTPSMACDIYAYIPQNKKLAYDYGTLTFLAGIITSSAKILHEKGVTNYLIRWGGNWDSDDIILKDQNFNDLPHFELIAAK